MFKSFFYADSKEKRIFILYIAIIAGLALVISLIVIFSSLPTNSVPEQPEIIIEHDILDTDYKIAADDFIVPDPWVRVHETQFHPFRDQLSSWGEEQVKHYWISPRKISIEILSKKNDNYIKELFEGIP